MGKNELIAIAKMEKKGFPKQIFFMKGESPRFHSYKPSSQFGAHIQVPPRFSKADNYAS
jgi:hypothetical protein